MFTFTLKPHEAALKNIIDVIAKLIRQLNRNIILSINNKNAEICAFTLKLIKDMPQQTNNSKIFRYNVQKGCRSYFVFKKKNKF